MDISIGPFKIKADVHDDGIKISAGIDWHGIKENANLNLSLSHPSASYNTPNIANFSAGVSASINSDSGILTLSVKECNPDPTWKHPLKQHCSTYSKSVQILPKSGLCLLATGITSAGLDFLTSHHTSVSCKVIQEIKPYITKDAIKGVETIGSGGISKLVAAVEKEGVTAAHTLLSLGEEKIMGLMEQVFADPRIKAMLPDGSVALEATELGDAEDTVKTVVEGVLAAAGLSLAVGGALIATVGLAIAAIAASATIGVPVALAVCIGALLVALAALAAGAVGGLAIVIGLIVYLAV